MNIFLVGQFGIRYWFGPCFYHFPCFECFLCISRPEFLFLISNFHKILHKVHGYLFSWRTVGKFTFMSMVVRFALTSFPIHYLSFSIVFMVVIFLACMTSVWVWYVLLHSLYIVAYFYSQCFKSNDVWISLNYFLFLSFVDMLLISITYFNSLSLFHLLYKMLVLGLP